MRGLIQVNLHPSHTQIALALMYSPFLSRPSVNLFSYIDPDAPPEPRRSRALICTCVASTTSDERQTPFFTLAFRHQPSRRRRVRTMNVSLSVMGWMHAFLIIWGQNLLRTLTESHVKPDGDLKQLLTAVKEARVRLANSCRFVCGMLTGL